MNTYAIDKTEMPRYKTIYSKVVIHFDPIPPFFSVYFSHNRKMTATPKKKTNKNTRREKKKWWKTKNIKKKHTTKRKPRIILQRLRLIKATVGLICWTKNEFFISLNAICGWFKVFSWYKGRNTNCFLTQDFSRYNITCTLSK